MGTRPAAGATGTPPALPGRPGGPASLLRRLAPGLLPALVLAVAATALGRLLPVVGAPVLAVIGGVTVALLRAPGPQAAEGLSFASKSLLKTSVVVLGTGLSFRQVLSVGGSSLPVLAATLTAALVGAVVLGRLLGVGGDLRTLIGVGTAICGASAIAATDAVLAASEADVAYAIATIFTFNVAAVLSFPAIGHALSLSPHAFGLWSGTAVNDLSSVVAASTVFGHGAVGYAVVVKLTRTLVIVPLVLGLQLRRPHRVRPSGVVPVFLAWFLVAVGLNTAGAVPAGWHGGLSALAQFLITTAMAAIGLSTRPRDLRRAGLRPMALGGFLWVLVTATSLGVQALTA